MPCQFGASSVTMRSAVVMILWIIIGSINLSLGQDNPHNPAPPKQPPQNPPPPPDSQNPPPSPPDPSTAKQLDPRCSLDISNICTTDRGNHNVPKANDCSSFYKCAGNSAAKNETCSQGELFDKTLLQCVTTSDVSICLLCPSTGTSPTYSSVSSSSTVISSTSTRSPLPSSSTTTTRASAGNSSSTTSDMQSSSSGSVTNVTSEKTDASKSSTDSSFSTASMSKSSATTSSTSTSSATTTENVSSTEHSKNDSSNTSLLTGMSENPGSSVSSPVSVSQTTISKFDSSSTTTGNFGMGSSSSVAVPSSLSTTAGSVDMPSSSDVSFESSTASTVQTVTTSSAVPLSTKLLSRNIYFSSMPSDIVVEGTYVEFQCKFIWRTDIGGTAQLDNFKWVLNGRELDATGRISINQTSAPLSDGSYVSTLKFSPVLSGDAGNLTCCALTSGFINSTSFSYRVFVKPRVAIDPAFVSAGPEDLVTLSCTAEEVSDVDAFLVSFNRITWLRSDQTILRTDNEHVNSSFPVVSTINETFLMSTNMTCVVELSLVNVTSNVAFVHITANDNEPGCQPQTANGVDWSFTKVGDSNFRPCPDDKAGIAVRLCSASNIWDQPDLSQCISKTLIDLKQQINVVKERNTALDNQTMTNLSVIIYNTIIDQVNMTEAEFQLSVEIITDMADIHVNSTTNTFLDKKELLTMMGTVSVLLDIPDSGKLSKSLAVLLLSSVDTYMSLYTKQIQSDSVFSVYQNMIVETGGFSSLKSTSSDRIEWQIPSWDKMDQTQQNSSSWADSYDNGIKVNPMTGHNRLNATMASNYTSSCIKTLGNLMPLTEDQIKNNSYINSYMVSLAIIGLNSGSTPPVNITLNHLKINKSMTGKCVYWNFSASDNGAWMDNGCETVYTNDTHTACNCSHLTNFAILMSPHPATGMDDVILSIVSMVGCLISVIALVLTIILYVSQWKKLKSKRAAVLLNLCVSLIIANIVFLAGSNQTKSEIGCKVVAALLHYFFLAAFFLMLLEGILLFMYVVCVFYVHRKSHTIVLLVSAWFIPAIIVAVSLGVTKTKGYGTEKTCWLSVGENVLWAFVGPALFVILVNLIIIIIVLVRLGSSKVRSDLKKKRNKIVSVLRNVVILSPILGVTWIFGVLSVSDGTVVFQYIFCIANSLQGLFIFVLHGLCHAKNKKSSVSSKQKRWTGPQSRVSVQRAHIPLTEGDSQEDLVRTNKAEKELYLEQNVVKQNSAYKVPFAHQLSNMSHVSNGTANTYMSNSLSANGTASPQ